MFTGNNEADLVSDYQQKLQGQQVMDIGNEFLLQGKQTEVSNSENHQTTSMFGQQNIDNLNLKSFPFSQGQNYFVGSTTYDKNNSSSVNCVKKDELLTSFDKLHENNEDEHNITHYFSTNNETSILNDQTDKTPSTSIIETQCNFQDKHNYDEHFHNNNEASTLDDLFADASLNYDVSEDPFSSLY